jgi:hypothetical protein
MMGLMSLAGASAYCAAKGALEQASEALAAEAGPLGIRVLIVEPGVFRTGFFGPALRSSAAIADYDGTAGGTRAWLAAVHGTQPGDPDKAAQAVLAALDLPSPPLRLALGEDAVSAIRAKITAARTGRRTPASGLNTTEVREWAKAQGIEVKDRGRVPAELMAKFKQLAANSASGGTVVMRADSAYYRAAFRGAVRRVGARFSAWCGWTRRSPRPSPPSARLGVSGGLAVAGVGAAAAPVGLGRHLVLAEPSPGQDLP